MRGRAYYQGLLAGLEEKPKKAVRGGVHFLLRLPLDPIGAGVGLFARGVLRV